MTFNEFIVENADHLILVAIVLLFCLVISIYAVAEDIRRKVLADHLEESNRILDVTNQKMNSIIDHIDALYWDYDIDEDLAYPAEAMKAKYHMENQVPEFSKYFIENQIIHEQSYQNHSAIYDRLRAGENEVRIICRLTTQTNDNIPQWRRIHYTAYTDPLTGHRMAVGTSENVIDQKRMDEATTTALQQINVGVLTYDIPLKRLVRLQEEPDGYFPKTNIVDNVPDCYVTDEKLYEEDRDVIIAMYEALQKGEKTASCVFRRYKEDGSLWWGRIRYTTILDPFGNAIRAVGTYRDITEQVENEGRYLKQLRFQNQMGKDAITYVRANIERDLVFDHHSINVGYEQLLKERRISDLIDKLATKIPSNVMQREFLDMFRIEALKEAYRKGQDTMNYLHLMNGYDVKPIWIRTQINLMTNPLSGDPEVVVYQFDASPQTFESQIVGKLLQLDYSVIYMLDPSRNLKIDLKKLAYDGGREEQDFEQDYDEDLHKLVMEYVVPEDRERVLFEMNRDEFERQVGKQGVYAVRFATKVDEELRYFRAQYVLIDDYLNIYAMAITDITKDYLIDMEKSHELELAVKEAERANSIRADFLSRMSHDIRTPMNAILGLTNLCHRDSKKPELMFDHLRKLEKTGGYLLNLINDMLDMTKIESGKMAFRREPFSIRECVEDICEINRSNIDQKQIEIRYFDNETTETVFMTDAMRFRQILMNLMSNAVKFTPEGGTIEIVANTLWRNETDIRFELKFSDTGIGMSEEFLEHLYEPFAQDGVAGGRDYVGTGLGLSIVKNLVEGLGGQIDVESSLGKGSTFTITMTAPLGTEPVAEAKKPDAEEDSERIEKLDGKCVLVVEDNDINYEIIEAILDDYGIRTQWAKNGREAVDYVAEGDEIRCDAILMDIRMPVMDGNEACRQIRMLDKPGAKEIPIAAMTANAFEEDHDQSIEAGMNYHLTKPIDQTILYRTLRKML